MILSNAVEKAYCIGRDDQYNCLNYYYYYYYLADRNRFSGGSTKCPGCSCEEEDLEHFLLDCPRYSLVRSSMPELQQPYESDRENILEKLLLFKPCKISFKFEIMDYLRKIHSIRKKIVDIDNE